MHAFDEHIAQSCGINAAVIFNYIAFWVDKNEKENRNFNEGSYWTYNSTRELSEHFIYLSEKQIRDAIRRLHTEGLIISSSFNKRKYDRTRWYTCTEKGRELYLASKDKTSPLPVQQPQENIIPSDPEVTASVTKEPHRDDPEGKSKSTKREIRDDREVKSNIPEKSDASPKKSNASDREGEPIPINTQLYPINNTESGNNKKKDSFGNYKNVKLTHTEHKKLIEDFGDDTVNDYIRRVDEFCEMNKKRYASYDAVIRKWIGEDSRKTPVRNVRYKREAKEAPSDIDKYYCVVNRFDLL